MTEKIRENRLSEPNKIPGEPRAAMNARTEDEAWLALPVGAGFERWTDL